MTFEERTEAGKSLSELLLSPYPHADHKRILHLSFKVG
jgi:hypothetical protein